MTSKLIIALTLSIIIAVIWAFKPEKSNEQGNDRSNETIVVLGDQNIERLKMKAFFALQNGDTLVYNILTSAANNGSYTTYPKNINQK